MIEEPITTETIQKVLQTKYSPIPSAKAQQYIGKFFNCQRRTETILGKVVGNHGTYTVSLAIHDLSVNGHCSCYIGKHGLCHHCMALAHTFLNTPKLFQIIEPLKQEDVKQLSQLPTFLQGVTLEGLLQQLKAKGISQKAVAETIGRSTRHLSTVKSSELRHHYFNELGAIKLACLWILDNYQKIQTTPASCK